MCVCDICVIECVCVYVVLFYMFITLHSACIDHCDAEFCETNGGCTQCVEDYFLNNGATQCRSKIRWEVEISTCFKIYLSIKSK